MKNFARLTVSFLLIMAISLAAATPLAPTSHATAASRQQQRPEQSQVRDVEVKTGAEVAARIKRLRETDRDVRAALGEFEKRGRLPKLDKAITISGKVQAGGVATNATRAESLFRQARFLAPPRQQTTMSENGVELTFVTSLDLYSEWQGTIIARRYDDYGNLIDEYVADAVITAPDNDHTQWTTRYEVSYVGGAPYLMHEPGMFTGFALGTSIQDHQTNFGAPPPRDIEPWQFVTTDTEQEYFQYYPGQMQYQTMEERQQYQQIQSGGGGRIQPMQPLALLKGDVFRPAGFRAPADARGTFFKAAAYQVRSDRAATREEMRQFCGNPSGCGPSAGQVLAPYTPRIKTWANNTAWSCSATAVGCGVVSAIFAEVPAAPCFVGGCTTMAVRNAFRDIFHVMN